MLFLSDKFKHEWEGSDPFVKAEAIRGKVFRQVKSRSTIQFRQRGSSYFIKIHRGVGWMEIIKNLSQLRLPIISAANEFKAIELLTTVNINTMKVMAFAKKGLNPATVHSFIVTQELTDTISLEDFCCNWKTEKPHFELKRKLIEKVATISRSMHGQGMCHRDYYICHFLLHEHSIAAGVRDSEPRLSLIDLHRALIKNNLAKRWVLKDIAGLYFSALNIGLTRNDLRRFIKVYSASSLREALGARENFWLAVEKKAQQMDLRLNKP